MTLLPAVIIGIFIYKNDRLRLITHVIQGAELYRRVGNNANTINICLISEALTS